jgi:hypothetical protein
MPFYDTPTFATTVYPGDPIRQQHFARGLTDGETWALGPSTPELFDLCVLANIPHRTGDLCHQAHLEFCRAVGIDHEDPTYANGFLWAARCVWVNELRAVVGDADTASAVMTGGVR